MRFEFGRISNNNHSISCVCLGGYMLMKISMGATYKFRFDATGQAEHVNYFCGYCTCHLEDKELFNMSGSN
ncbi:hypothetical protein EJB05_26803 [Eragrostis curvula]|uniref:Uncharacterized protein n=1 Tax=Eragrostis curvula TaxID=38414 RepID=A0A5J9UMG8_9POAL|nr:hypothetical protein EJB05_26803 [Eragrostis curvula]